MIQAIFLFILVLSFHAEARKQPVAPLMPPREKASMLSPAQQMRTSKIRLRAERSALGFEMGAIGVGNQTSGDVLGFQLLYGARANAILPLSTRFFIKPSLGYFFKPESEGEVSIRQNVIEAGLAAQYGLVFGSGWMWHVGISQRMDYLFTRIAVKDSSANTPASFRYRVGPSTGVRIKLSPSSDFTFDVEGGVTPFETLRAQTSVTSGIVFFLD